MGKGRAARRTDRREENGEQGVEPGLHQIRLPLAQPDARPMRAPEAEWLVGYGLVFGILVLGVHVLGVRVAQLLLVQVLVVRVRVRRALPFFRVAP